MTITLDWTKLLGFDQALASQTIDTVSLTDPRVAQLGTKLGVKIGNKPDLRDVRHGPIRDGAEPRRGGRRGLRRQRPRPDRIHVHGRLRRGLRDARA